jgi:hypothetical protein
MKSEVLMVMKTSMLAFWIVTPCGQVGRYQRFRGTYCHHHHGQTNYNGYFMQKNSAPKTVAVIVSKTSDNFFTVTWHQKQEKNGELYMNQSENLKSYTEFNEQQLHNEVLEIGVHILQTS